MDYPCWSCTNALYYEQMEEKNFTDAWTVQATADDMATATGLEAFFPDPSRIVTKNVGIKVKNHERCEVTVLYDKEGNVTPAGNILVLKKTETRYTSIGKRDLVTVATALQW